MKKIFYLILCFVFILSYPVTADQDKTDIEQLGLNGSV